MARVAGVLILLLLAYELVAIWTPAPGDTLSELVWGANEQYPVIAFLAGLLCGHWFWPRRP